MLGEGITMSEGDIIAELSYYSRRDVPSLAMREWFIGLPIEDKREVLAHILSRIEETRESFEDMGTAMEGVTKALFDLGEMAAESYLRGFRSSWRSRAAFRLRRFLWCARGVCRVTWFLNGLRSRVQYRLTGSCGNLCGETEEYGFVPEANCPVHDRESKKDD